MHTNPPLTQTGVPAVLRRGTPAQMGMFVHLQCGKCKVRDHILQRSRISFGRGAPFASAAPLTSAMPQLGLSPATLLLRIFASHGIFKHLLTKGRPIWRTTTTNR